MVAALFVVFIISNKKSKEAILRMQEYSTNINALIDDSIPRLLESVITECFNDYQILVLIPKNENYITDEREKEIRDDLVMKVSERLSPMMLDKLSLWYNPVNIGSVIADRIYILVMNYVVEHNAEFTFKNQNNQ